MPRRYRCSAVPGAVLLLCRKIAACSQAFRWWRICASRRAPANGARTACWRCFRDCGNAIGIVAISYPVLMTNPRLLVLDEATEGLAPLVRDEIWHTIRVVRDSGIAVVVVDKTVSAVLSLADRVTVLVKGGVVYSGTPHLLREDAELMHRHLGI